MQLVPEAISMSVCMLDEGVLHMLDFQSCRIVEKMLMYYPNYVNLQKKDNGYSLLHTTAASMIFPGSIRQYEMMELILQQVSPTTSHQYSNNTVCLRIVEWFHPTNYNEK